MRNGSDGAKRGQNYFSDRVVRRSLMCRDLEVVVAAWMPLESVNVTTHLIGSAGIP